MFDDVVKEILEIVSKGPKSSFPLLGDGCTPFKISERYFHQINSQPSSKTVAFVDGGNSEIFSSPNLLLSLIRTGFAVYQNNKKISSGKSEFFSVIKAVNKQGKIYYEASFFSSSEKMARDSLLFDSFDQPISTGSGRADIKNITGILRRFAELAAARKLAEGKKADIIVLDGNLQKTYTNEDVYLDSLFGSCLKNGAILCAISKTNSIFTDDGNLLSAALESISPKGTWYYHPIADIDSKSHRAEMYFLRLHAGSRHVFRFEIFIGQKTLAEEAINLLSSNSKDPVFLGYPYGLIEADRIARVSKQEADSLRTMLLLKLKNRKIDNYLSAANAHDILDRISF